MPVCCVCYFLPHSESDEYTACCYMDISEYMDNFQATSPWKYVRLVYKQFGTPPLLTAFQKIRRHNG